MPLFEYECKRCGRATTLMELPGRWNFLRRKCASCGSRRVRRLYSTFSTAKKQSMGDLIHEMRRLGPVNFVPSQPRMPGPPPGGCPYAVEEKGGAKGTGKG